MEVAHINSNIELSPICFELAFKIDFVSDSTPNLGHR